MPAAESVGPTLVSARTLAEYRAMFALDDGDLTGRIVDCPGGAASFTAEACAFGADATAVDPAYGLPGDEFAAQALADADRSGAWIRAHPERYVWTHFADVEDLRRTRRLAARRCLAHRAAQPRRYVAAGLPLLPFPDGYADLVLSAHLLFTYADRLDVDFHRAALRELIRISAGEVRIFPLLDYTGPRYPRLDALLTELTGWGLRVSVRTVDYEVQRGANQMLVLSR